MSKSKKGSKFEREICSQLSLWWSKDYGVPRDDLFWRTAGSGGRATNRGKKGKETAGHYGDICAVDGLGVDLLKFMTCELKRGYSKHTIFDLIDKVDGAAKQEYEKWFKQAYTSMLQAKSVTWAIIAKRDRRKTMIYMPVNKLRPFINLDQLKSYCEIICGDFYVGAVCFESFLESVKPSQIINMIK